MYTNMSDILKDKISVNRREHKNISYPIKKREAFLLRMANSVVVSAYNFQYNNSKTINICFVCQITMHSILRSHVSTVAWKQIKYSSYIWYLIVSYTVKKIVFILIKTKLMMLYLTSISIFNLDSFASWKHKKSIKVITR